MMTKFEKVLNPWVLLSINVFIILATELSGSFFIDKGTVHLIAILFVVLGISRVFVHYDAYDRYLRLLIKGGTAALIIFSVSHLIEFLGYTYFKIYEDAIFINVVNFYIMSMLVVAVGAEYFLRTLKKKSAVATNIFITGIVALFVLTVLIFLNKVSVSLEPDELAIYFYAALVLVVFFLSVSRLIKIKKHVSIMVGFIDYFISAFVLITISALQFVFYDVLKGLGMPVIQVIYVSHFLFYGALSFIFLAFARLANLQGIYQEAQKIEVDKVS
jgi:hypothetical protein